MASELGSMVVTEQIDAMRALGTDPIKKLVTPRVVSTIVMLFFLTILGDLLGLFGGNLVASLLLGLDSHEYWSNAWQILVFSDVFMWDWSNPWYSALSLRPSAATTDCRRRVGPRVGHLPRPWWRP